MVGQTLAALDAGDPIPAGDATLLPGRVELASVPQISRIFGADFADGLGAQPVERLLGRAEYLLHGSIFPFAKPRAP